MPNEPTTEMPRNTPASGTDSQGTQNRDTPQDRLAKLLPGDVTAAFLSSKVALEAATTDAVQRSAYVFWTYIAILVLCPLYFWFVAKAKSRFHITFLTVSFAVFGLSIAHVEFAGQLSFIPPEVVKAAAIVLPILWTYLVTQISVAALNHEQDKPASAPLT
jgi:hypothetical protein